MANGIPDAHIFNNFFAGSTNGGGGWGSEYLSWELYFSYEKMTNVAMLLC